MLGEFVDDYTVRVADVFAMPQSGTGVSVEAVDPVFQTKMLDMLKQVGRCASYPRHSAGLERIRTARQPEPPVCRPEMVVGWYHSHPGFGCWLSGVDINTQQVCSVHCCPHNRAWLLQQQAESPMMQSFEALNQRAVAVVVDPIQSVKGKVVIDAFRSELVSWFCNSWTAPPVRADCAQHDAQAN